MQFLSLLLVAFLATVVRGRTNDTAARGYLLQLLTIYTDAIQTGNTSFIPVAPNVRITDNGNDTTLGKGTIWNIAGGVRLPYRHTVVDTVSGAATIQATVTNYTASTLLGAPVNATLNNTVSYFYSLRLKVENQLITEIEELAGDASFPGSPGALSIVWPDRIWDAIIPEEERLTRDELLAIADDYFSAVTGTLWWQDAPFHPECNRLEDADQTTNGQSFGGGCGTEFVGGTHWNVTNRRFYIGDPVRGIAVAIAKFTPPTPDTVIMEQFKIQDGLISHVEAFYSLNGPVNGSGWPDGST